MDPELESKLNIIISISGQPKDLGGTPLFDCLLVQTCRVLPVLQVAF